MLGAAASLRLASSRAGSLSSSCAAVSRIVTRGFASDGDFTVEVTPFESHKIDPPSNVVTTSKAELLDFFKSMYTMRRMEIAADMMYKAKMIRGFCHLYDGQEAVIEGIKASTTFNDSIITSYRDHCTHLARGGTVKEVMSELFGRVDGASKGKGGSMHMYKKENNFYGGCGIVGAQVPLGAGLGFSHKYKKDGSISMTLYGDGAANQGQLYEALNMAALWNLPTLFICENNHYGMGTAEWRHAKSSSFYTRGDYTPGLKIDGMDVLAVKQGMAFAKQYALEHGPMIIEMDTYRYHGHSMSDPGSTYRSRDEIASVRQKRDPVEHVRKMLLDHGMDPAELKKLEKELKKQVDTAVEEAKASPKPQLDAMWEHVYKQPVGTVRNVDGSRVTLA